MKISEINSAGIRAAAAAEGVEKCFLLASAGAGDHKITVYQIEAVRVADTNSEPVWEEADHAAFAELLAGAGIVL